MKYRLFLLSLFFTTATHTGDKENKERRSSKEIEIACPSCSSYVLTTNRSFSGTNIMYWESITKPASLVAPSDVSDYLPMKSLAAIYCNACKEMCCDPVWHMRSGTLKAAYRVISEKVKK
jgi:hypothetical protein